MPDPYVKRPNPYPEEVEKDYDEYKKYHDLNSEARQKSKNNHLLLRTSENNPRYRQIMETVRDTAHDSMIAANNASAARAGFDHKYPYAYENPGAKQTHQKTAMELLNGARRARIHEQKASRALPGEK